MYSESTRKKALQLLEQGLSVREVSARLEGNPSKSTISKWALGYVPTGHREAGRRDILVADKLRALERLAAGEPYRQVAADAGCTPSAVLIWRKAYEAGGVEALKTARDKRDEMEAQYRKPDPA